MKNLGLVFYLFLSFLSVTVKAQESDPATLKEMITSKHFVFTPQTMTPMSGSTRQVTGGFELSVNGDSLSCYLPYFGRAYTVSPGEGGMNFNSSSFEYKAKQKKINSWEITIKPKDQDDVRQLNFTIYKNGYARLFASSNNRQSIQYYGFVSKKG